jgi:putative transcriptional regulator
MNDSLAKKLINSTRQAREHSEGKRKLHQRTVEIRPLPNYSAHQIRNLRERFNLTRSVMAGVIGVSTKTIESWETGARRPSGAALRVIEELDNDPQFLTRFVTLQ